MNCFHWLFKTVSRLEERDTESRKEYGKLHERYTDVGNFVMQSVMQWSIAVYIVLFEHVVIGVLAPRKFHFQV